MNLKAVNMLFAYNRWANEQILNAAGNLTDEQFVAPDDTPFGSIRNELVHIIDAQRSWVERIQASLKQRAYVSDDLDPASFPDLESIRALHQDSERAAAAFLATISSDQLDDVLSFAFAWGDISAPMWELMLHIVNHGTQHRSEIAMKLTNFGHSPGMLDLLFFNQADASWEAEEAQASQA